MSWNVRLASTFFPLSSTLTPRGRLASSEIGAHVITVSLDDIPSHSEMKQIRKRTVIPDGFLLFVFWRSHTPRGRGAGNAARQRVAATFRKISVKHVYTVLLANAVK